MVRLKGLEPSRRGHQILSLARLPIPPQARGVVNFCTLNIISQIKDFVKVLIFLLKSCKIYGEEYICKQV